MAASQARFEVGLMGAAFFRGANPGFHLDIALPLRITPLGFDFDFDLYYFEPDEAVESADEPAV